MIFLVDNGSVRPEAYKNLCSIAALVSESIGEKVLPAPLLHADKIPGNELGGGRAVLLEELIKEAYAGGEMSFDVLPLFFGPSGALVDYLPRRLRILNKKYPGLKVRILNPLFISDKNGGDILTNILQERVQQLVEQHQLKEYKVAVVDHGSPRKEVTEVRNGVAIQLAHRFEASGIDVAPASMERRSGVEYDFNDPLLKNLLANKPFNAGVTIVAQLFVSPGRHAGAHGDIAVICASAETALPRLRTFRTELIGTHPLLIDLLSRRWKERAELSWLEL
jgi:hypothetical protein